MANGTSLKQADGWTLALRVILILAGVAALAFAVIVLVWPAPFASAKKSQTTTTETGSSGKSEKIVVSSGQQSPSDGLIGAIAGVGGALLLIAAFFPRITSVKAFGVEIGLSEADKDTVAEAGKTKVAAALQNAGVPPEQSEDLARNLLLVGIDAGELARAQKTSAVVTTAMPPPAPAPAGEALEARVVSQEEAAKAIDDATSKRLGI